MNDTAEMWMPSTPKLPEKKSKALLFSSTTFFVVLFVCLIIVAIPTVYFLPKIASTNPVIESTNIDVPELLSNCAYFYQLCDASSLGVVQLQSVDQLLTTLNSPLQQAGLLLHSEIDNPNSTEAPPSQIITLIAAKYNLNPFLLLTLSEMDSHLVTQPIDIKPTVEAGGDQSGLAWFSLQHQTIALELQKSAQAAQLAPNNLDDTSNLKSVKIGTKEVKLSGSFSVATQVVVEYLAAHSTSVKDFQTKLNAFIPTYQQLWGIDPSTSSKSPVPR